MDDQFLYDIRKALEDGLECEDWNCITEALEMILEYQEDFDTDDYLEY